MFYSAHRHWAFTAFEKERATPSSHGTPGLSLPGYGQAMSAVSVLNARALSNAVNQLQTH
jgi:hypothetical protein